MEQVMQTLRSNAGNASARAEFAVSTGSWHSWDSPVGLGIALVSLGFALFSTGAALVLIRSALVGG
jgi:hypothetical protein